MTPEATIQRLMNEPSILERETIIRENLREYNTDFFQGFKLAYDKSITFGVSTKTPKRGSGSGLAFADFVEMVQPLIERETTGDAAIRVLEQAASRATPEQWEFWYRRIVVKNLDCGTTSTLINKVLLKHASVNERRNYTVPTFDCQLATDIKKVKEINTARLGEVLVQPKLDGVRVLARVSKGGTTLFSRNGKVFENFPRIEKDLSACIAQFEHDVVWIDGEVVSKDFRTLMTQANRKENAKTTDCVFAIFDFLPDAEFKAGEWRETNARRHATLESVFTTERTTGTSLSLVVSQTLNYKTQQVAIRDLIKSHIAQGYEGTMIKDAGAAYTSKRTKAWMKVKPTIMLTAKVVDVAEGEGKYAGSLGALVCEAEYEGKTIRFSVGSGLTDEQRAEFWANKSKLLEQLIEVEADSVSQAQDGEYSLRFPRFIMFRGFVAGEQL